MNNKAVHENTQCFILRIKSPGLQDVCMCQAQLFTRISQFQMRGLPANKEVTVVRLETGSAKIMIRNEHDGSNVANGNSRGRMEGEK
jgi:hypothetical protein